MNFKNYCIIIMGETKGCKIEVVKISEDTPRFLEAKGVTIATFLSVAEPGELTEYFKSFNRNFLVFELKKDVSGYNIKDKVIHKMLFGHLDIGNTFKSYEDKTNKLMDEISNNINSELKITNDKDTSHINTNKYVVNDSMSKKEIEKLIDTILDKGNENMTDYDKKTLEELRSFL